LRRLQRLIARSLERTRAFWPDLRRAYAWVHEAARILKNEAHLTAGLTAGAVARRFAGLLGAMARHRAKVGSLAGAIDHFLKVSRSYWPGLFHCDAGPNLPRMTDVFDKEKMLLVIRGESGWAGHGSH
jgi:hypothetical protein